MLFRNGTHLVDLATSFVAAEPAWVMAELDDEHADYGSRYMGDGGRDPATDPGLSGYIHFSNGVRAFLNASKGTPELFEIDLFGETGRLRLGNWGAERWYPVEDGFAVAPLHAPRTTRSGTIAALHELIDLVERGGQATSTGEDGRRVLAILLGLLQSADQGSRPVPFPITD
jgi:predicted dehydrogenase